MNNLEDGEPGHVVDPKTVGVLASALAVRVTKDATPNKTVATSLAALAKRVADSDKELHIILAGCNTVGLVSHLHKATVSDEVRKQVWVVCTDEVWPSDLAPFLWHHYGGLVQKGDLSSFRLATRTLLGEYTEHYKRQRIQDETLREARAQSSKPESFDESLANSARCERLDRVSVTEGDNATVSLL